MEKGNGTREIKLIALDSVSSRITSIIDSPHTILLDIVANALTKLYVMTQAYLKAYNVPFQCQLQER